MCRKTTVLTENIAIFRGKKDVSQKCHVVTYGSPKKKKIWPFLRWLPANISAVFPLCFCSHKVIYVQVLSSWFSSCTNDFDCLFIVLSEHFCLPCHISWTSVSVIYRQLLCPCRVSPLFLLSCLWLFVCIICKFLEVKNGRKRTISSPCWPRK